MISKSRFVVLLTATLVLLSASVSYAFFSGTAKATGTVERATAKNADIVAKKGTGGLTVVSVEVLDIFGHPKRVTATVVKGATSTSPTLEFTPPLERGDYVSVELKTGNDGDHGYLDLKFY